MVVRISSDKNDYVYGAPLGVSPINQCVGNMMLVKDAKDKSNTRFCNPQVSTSILYDSLGRSICNSAKTKCHSQSHPNSRLESVDCSSVM